VKLSTDVHFAGRRRRRQRAHEVAVAADTILVAGVVVVKRKFAFLTSFKEMKILRKLFDV
jgi:hypothetical protein